MIQSDADLKADCSKYFGLCCIALRFERSDGFGHDKAAGQPCHFLETDFRCRIHADRDDLGYEGCGEFDCLGAGQLASASFAAQNWQRDAGVARTLYARFAQLLTIQEMRQALLDAETLDLSLGVEQKRQQLIDELRVEAENGSPDLGHPGSLIEQARALLQSV